MPPGEGGKAEGFEFSQKGSGRHRCAQAEFAGRPVFAGRRREGARILRGARSLHGGGGYFRSWDSRFRSAVRVLLSWMRWIIARTRANTRSRSLLGGAPINPAEYSITRLGSLAIS